MLCWQLSLVYNVKATLTWSLYKLCLLRTMAIPEPKLDSTCITIPGPYPTWKFWARFSPSLWYGSFCPTCGRCCQPFTSCYCHNNVSLIMFSKLCASRCNSCRCEKGIVSLLYIAFGNSQLLRLAVSS